MSDLCEILNTSRCEELMLYLSNSILCILDLIVVNYLFFFLQIIWNTSYVFFSKFKINVYHILRYRVILLSFLKDSKKITITNNIILLYFSINT